MSLTHIETIELGSSQSSITFSSIPQDYDDLVVLFSSRSTSDNQFVAWMGFEVIANNITAGYSGVMLEGNGSTAYSQTNGTSAYWNYGASPDSATTANTFSNGQIYISNYTAAIAKSYSMDRVTENNAGESSQLIYAGLLNNTAAITGLTFTDTGSGFAANSTFSLYGITAGGDGTVTTS